MIVCIPAEAHKVVKRFLSKASAPCKRDGRAEAGMLTAMVTNPWGQRILIGSPPNIWLLNVHTNTHTRTKKKKEKQEMKCRKNKSANDTHGYRPYKQ